MNELESLFTKLSTNSSDTVSDAITKEDFKKKDCKKGNGGWKKEDLLKICKDLDIKLTSKEKASKELLCEKINNYFNTNVVNVSNVVNVNSERSRTNRPSPSDSATQFPVGTTKIGNDGKMYKVILTSNGIKRWVKTTDTVTSESVSDTVSSDMPTTDTVTSDVSTTISNLENLPNEIILIILEKMPPSSVFNIIRSSKKMNINKNHIKYYGKVDLQPLILYKEKEKAYTDNKKEFKEAFDFVYQYICEGEVSQVNIKKWIKGIMKGKDKISADEAVIIGQFILNNTKNSSKFLLKYVRNKLDFDVSNIEEFETLIDINAHLNSLWEGEDEIEEIWPDNHNYCGYVRMVFDEYRDKFIKNKFDNEKLEILRRELFECGDPEDSEDEDSEEDSEDEDSEDDSEDEDSEDEDSENENQEYQELHSKYRIDSKYRYIIKFLIGLKEKENMIKFIRAILSPRYHPDPYAKYGNFEKIAEYIEETINIINENEGIDNKEITESETKIVNEYIKEAIPNILNVPKRAIPIIKWAIGMKERENVEKVLKIFTPYTDANFYNEILYSTGDRQ